MIYKQKLSTFQLVQAKAQYYIETTVNLYNYKSQYSSLNKNSDNFFILNEKFTGMIHKVPLGQILVMCHGLYVKLKFTKHFSTNLHYR